MKRILRALLTILIVAAIGVGAVVLVQSNAISAPSEAEDSDILDETTAQRGDLSVTISGTGAVLPERQVALFFEAPGTVAEILVREGERVEAGQVIARLDTTDLQAILNETRIALDLQTLAYDAATAPPRDVDVAVAEAALTSAEASAAAAYNTTAAQQVEIARLQGEIARNRLWQAQLQRDLQVNAPTGISVDVGSLLPPDSGVPQDVIDQANVALAGLFPVQPAPSSSSFDAGLTQAEYGVSIADANYDATAGRPGDFASLAQANAAIIASQTALDRLINGATENELQIAQIAVDQARLAVQQAQATLDRAVLTAPFNGVIAQSDLTIGESPPAQSPAALLVDDGALYVDLAIDETDVVDVAVGQTVSFRFDALPAMEITGTVTEIAIAPTIIGQLVTYPVRARIDLTDDPIRIGMTATATIVVNELIDVVILPNRFIRIDRTSQQAFVAVERTEGTTRRGAGRYEEVPIELGLRSETESEIVSGIAAGDRVVLLPRASFDPLTGGPPN